MLDPSHRGGVVAEQCNPLCPEISAHRLHDQPQEEQACHFKLGVGDRPFMKKVLDLLRPFPSKYCWDACLVLAKYDAVDPV
jgi:hypothetical protein